MSAQSGIAPQPAHDVPIDMHCNTVSPSLVLKTIFRESGTGGVSRGAACPDSAPQPLPDTSPLVYTASSVSSPRRALGLLSGAPRSRAARDKLRELVASLAIGSVTSPQRVRWKRKSFSTQRQHKCTGHRDRVVARSFCFCFLSVCSLAPKAPMSSSCAQFPTTDDHTRVRYTHKNNITRAATKSWECSFLVARPPSSGLG